MPSPEESSPQHDLGIVVAVDGSPGSDAAVAWAAAEAVRRAVPVTLMSVSAPVIATWSTPNDASTIAKAQEDSSHDILGHAVQTFAAAVGGTHAPGVRTESRPSPVVGTLAEASRQALLLVVGNRGTGGHSRLPLGSVAAGLLHHARCPVVVVHPGDAADPSAPVVLGVDGSTSSDAATELAFEEAALRGVELIAVHAWSDVGLLPLYGTDWQIFEDQARSALADRLADWQRRFPDVRVQVRLVQDRPAHWITEEARNAQLVVVGSRGRGGFVGLVLGSVASTVAQLSTVPVIVVRGADHQRQ
ncbi:universal stress protein [Arthrobacter sp. SLBN-53]|uniref:universal stress protein n=1 Tax=Arthrobacter sp. SLBN-53 TaxID=2768412 RepID=UPI001151577C|nr:universal stress protein [Arthrobacter sp. SLBN-53]TQK27135.1 nucleotide-binding universal stress UspA family protein [Arthrobacter sp. SLBN-53]